ncbi:MAG: hypothetical protein RIS34_681 [Pseudomonadota bacterium]|jgi:hypothetical protein
MNYVTLPIERIEIGKPLPVNVWDARGNLLLRKGQAIVSAQHKEHLAAHKACATEADHKAWVRSYDRLVYAMLRDGMSMGQISRATMPTVILNIDYGANIDMGGNWFDLQAVLTSVLYPGEGAKNALERLDGLQKRATELATTDPDDSLFSLFQALADPASDYCATHALLSAVIGDLTAQKLDVEEIVRPVLFRAALTMNISMAREQDKLTRQITKPDASQRQLIQDHASNSAAILRSFGVVNDDLLDIVGLHHDRDETKGLARNLECRRILRMTDERVAMLAARSTRVALSALSAARSSLINAVGEDARVGSAMTNALGFYPPGTYVSLANGEKAVAIKRGVSASTPVVVSIVDAEGVPLVRYVARDTRDKKFTVQTPVSADTIRLRVNPTRTRTALKKFIPVE